MLGQLRGNETKARRCGQTGGGGGEERFLDLESWEGMLRKEFRPSSEVEMENHFQPEAELLLKSPWVPVAGKCKWGELLCAQVLLAEASSWQLAEEDADGLVHWPDLAGLFSYSYA